MCLAIPGRVLTLEEDSSGLASGLVQFGQVRRTVCFVYTPEAKVGDYVIVHVGFAIQRLDEEAARRTLAELQQLSNDGEVLP